MWIIAAVVAVAVLLYIFSIRCRGNHPGMAELKKYSYAHRGFHGNGVPENSLAAFALAKEKGYGIELDLHLMKDGTLAVIHDSSLKRTAGADLRVEDLTVADLEKYRLEGTEERIPTFDQVLKLYSGTAPLIVELKPVNKNHAALAEAACKMLSEYSGAYCIESFDPRVIIWLKRNRPEIIRGQLAADFFASREDISFPVKFVLTHNMMNFLSVPDFIAYKFAERKHSFSNFLCRRLWKGQGVGWTIRDKETHDLALKEGWISIFEYFEA